MAAKGRKTKWLFLYYNTTVKWIVIIGSLLYFLPVFLQKKSQTKYYKLNAIFLLN